MWVNKLIVFLSVIVFLTTLVQNSAFAREIVVDANNSSADFKSIQEAVNNSSSGDLIFVYPGFYNESVDLRIQNISILSYSEDSKDTIIRALKLSANNNTVSGFSIRENLVLEGRPTDEVWYGKIENCTVKNNILESGIHAYQCYNSTIEKNVILNSGIFISSPGANSNFTISDNLIINGDISVRDGSYNCVLLNNTLLNGGIGVAQGPGCKILGNYISNGIDNGYGIVFSESSSNEVENNTIVNCINGVFLSRFTGSNIVQNNTLKSNDRGIYIENSGDNLFSNNDISKNNIGILVGGLTMEQAGANSILNNTISSNNIGISFEGDSSGNTVINNKVELNKQYGVYINQVNSEMPYDGINRFYNNIFNNIINFNDTGNYIGNYYISKPANISAGKNSIVLNTTKTSGINIVGGPYIGGNYWEKPDGTGFSQICADSNGDGIGDLAYEINENESDYLPLVSVSRSQESIIPFAKFRTNITHTLAPLSVQFTDFSQNAVAWSWDFDSNGISDSTKQNPTYLYMTTGTYIVNLTASNGKETSSKTQKIIVQEAKIPPVANFSTNVTDGQVPLSVQFTDLSKNATAVIWDFNNDGTPDSTERNPVYVYTYPGNYTVNLTVNNTKGMDSKSSTLTVCPAQRQEGKLILTEFQITTNKSDEIKPVIYGDKILWQSNLNGNYTLHLYNISTSSETKIASSNNSEFYPSIYDDRVVWQQSGNIYLYNLSTSTKTLIANELAQASSTIYKDRIVWIGSRAGKTNIWKTNIYMYNLSTSNETQITSSESSKSNLGIYGDLIVWLDYQNEKKEVYMYNLSTSNETQITTNESNPQYPAIYSDRIIWADGRTGYFEIYMYNTSTSTKTRIATNQSVQEAPIIYGDRIVWMNYLDERAHICMYDLSTSTETRVTTNESDPRCPAIYGNRIVWVDWRNGNCDIYMYTVSEERSGSKTVC